MGHSHGTKWSEDLIKEKILEVVEALELKRMPSSRECVEYFYNNGLSNAISRKAGWRTLAEEMGLPVKESETAFGKSYETMATEQLNAMGHETRRMPQNFPYDILADDCIKVDVKASRLYHGPHGNFYTFNTEKPYTTCDIYILYLVNDDKTQRNALIVPSKFVPMHKQISVGELSGKYYKYSDRWDFFDTYSAFLSEVV